MLLKQSVLTPGKSTVLKTLIPQGLRHSRVNSSTALLQCISDDKGGACSCLRKIKQMNTVPEQTVLHHTRLVPMPAEERDCSGDEERERDGWMEGEGERDRTHDTVTFKGGD